MRQRLARCGAALLALAVTLPAGADEPFGRLFHSPEERLRIDRGELAQRQEAVEQATRAPLRLDGIVRRSDGHSRVWVDGRAAEGGLVSVQPDGRSARVRLPDGRQRDLRVGESSGEGEVR